MMKLTIEEVVKLKNYCVKNKDYELGAKMREEEKKLKKKAGIAVPKTKKLKSKVMTNWFAEWDKAIKSIPLIK